MLFTYFTIGNGFQFVRKKNREKIALIATNGIKENP